MIKETGFKQVQNLIFAGLKNLFNSQDELDFDKFRKEKEIGDFHLFF